MFLCIPWYISSDSLNTDNLINYFKKFIFVSFCFDCCCSGSSKTWEKPVFAAWHDEFVPVSFEVKCFYTAALVYLHRAVCVFLAVSSLRTVQLADHRTDAHLKTQLDGIYCCPLHTLNKLAHNSSHMVAHTHTQAFFGGRAGGGGDFLTDPCCFKWWN